MDPHFPELILSHIVACGEGRVIGQGGSLPWHIPEDFRLFKKVTTGRAMIMGRKTFESIGKALPGRLSVVVTNTPGWSAPGVVSCPSIAAALAHCYSVRAEWEDEVFVIGGGMLYAATMPIVDRIYYSAVPIAVAGDTFYPEIPPSEFALTHEETVEANIPFQWRIFERNKTRAAST
jgi:dihydrofolate reductase